jgi:uncharacterized repeat protein (TIGR01451 family)
MIMEAHSRATPTLSPANNKVIVYPTSTEKIEQLAQRGITKVRNYGSYWLVQATDAQVDELAHLYGARAVKENDLNRIRLTSLSFDTTAGDPVVPANLRQENGAGKCLRLVQLRGPVVPEWLHRIESSGARVISYVPNNAYLVFVDPTAEKRLEQTLGSDGPIQWIGAYHPYYKIAPDLRFLSGTEPLKVRVAIVDRSGEPQAESGVYAMGTVLASLTRSGQEIVEMEVLPSAIEKIARLADVLWIQKVERHILLDEVQDLLVTSQTNAPGFGPTNAPIVGLSNLFTNYMDFLTNIVGGGASYYGAFTNQFAYPVVDVADTGLDVDYVVHPSFFEFGNSSNATRVVYEEPPDYLDAGDAQLGCEGLNWPYQTGAEDFYQHGTPVASVIAGYDVGTNTPTVLIYTTIITQSFSASITAGSVIGCTSSSGTGSGVFVFATSPCQLTTNLAVPCPSSGAPIYQTLALETVITNTVQVPNARQDANGFQLGLGVSPFGRIGISRIWAQNAEVVDDAVVLEATTFCINSEESFIASAYFWGGRIQNNSWSDGLNTDGSNGGQYNEESQTFDTAVRDALLVGTSNSIPGPSPLNQEFIVVFAANSGLGDAGASGNVGGFGDIRLTAPSTAKNVITVGSAESVRLVGGCAPANQEDDSFELYQYTAFGPTLDGRFKPEIVAPGTAIYGASSLLVLYDDPVHGIVHTVNEDFEGNLGDPIIAQSQVLTNLYTCSPFIDTTLLEVTPIATGLYECDSGSSYAAPAVSGAIQLLWWYFENRLTNELGRALLQPSPAMAKAYVCNAARYLPITNPQTGAMDTLPSNAQGMGELDLLRMFDGVGRAIRDESSPRAIDSPLITTNPAAQQTYFSQSGQSYQLSGQVASNGLPFRVTLAWTDAPGTPPLGGLVNNLDLQVKLGGVTYKGNVFAQNVSVPGGAFDSVNNMESVFLNPTNTQAHIAWPNGIPAVTSGAPFQVTVIANNIAGQGVPNVGEPTPGGSNTLNQDFALVVYNAATNTLSDVPNLATNNSCQTAIVITNFPFSFANVLTNFPNSATNGYNKVFPSPTAGTGGSEEFFRLPLPTAGSVITVDMTGSDLDAVLSVWEVQVVPQTVLVRSECGALTEIASQATALPSTPEITFTADGANDYFIVAEGNSGATGPLVLNVNRQCTVSLSPSSLPSSYLDAQYSTQLTATGGAAPYTFTVSSTNGLPPGLTLVPRADGITADISGVPTNTGTYQFAIVATDADGCSVSATYSITIVTCPSPTLSPSSLPSASLGVPYSEQLIAPSGTLPFIFTVSPANGLPPGLTLASTGLISGTPTKTGTSQVTITATNANGCTASGTYAITVTCPSLTLSPSNLPSSGIGVQYSEQLTAAGGTPPFTFAVSQGGLPPGLTLASTTGLISGVPTNQGTYAFTITATNTNGCTVSSAYTIAISCPSVSLSPPSLPPAGVGQPYGQAITASGGQLPVTFRLAVGPLPPGLALINTATSGVVTGTPTAVGVYSFKVAAVDTNGCTGSAFYTINVECPTITLSPSSLPGGTEFASYNPQTLTASGGTAPYTFSQTGGSLPAGMTLSTNGVLSGTPTSVSSAFTVTATDKFGCMGSQTYTLILADPNPPVTVTMLPGTLTSGVVGQNYNQTITAKGGYGPYTFAVSSGSLPPGLATNMAGSTSFVLSGIPTTPGPFTFTVTATDSENDVGQTSYTINVTSVAVTNSAVLAVSAVLSPQSVMIESNLTCTVTVTNLGPSPATGVTISNTLPVGATFVPSSSGCAADGNTVVCNVGSLLAGSTATISYLMQATQAGSISVASSVTAADSVTSSTTASGTVVPPYTVATNSKPNVASIVDTNGDIVTASLKGPGSLQVRVLGGGNNGPIDQIVLTGTKASSSLTIQVKGGGLVNVGSITSDGSLKTINGTTLNVTGAGIQVGGSLGTIKANALLNSALSVNGSGGIGTLQLNEMSNSVCTVTNGMMKTVNVGVYVDSKINAEAIKTVKLGTVTTENGNQEFGIQVQNVGGTVTVSHPRLKWKITSSIQSTNDFQVVTSP